MARRGPKEVVPRRGEVHLVRLDATIGVEIKKTRPAVVVQNDISNRFTASTIVVPLTSRARERLYPTEALVRRGEGGLRADSIAVTRQLRVVDKRRLVRRLGTLAAQTMRAVDQALLVTLGLVEL
jgi:mRNA interferase MazF